MTQKQTQNDQPRDPKNPSSKPNATTQDQVANMESEGQAQQSGRVDLESNQASVNGRRTADRRALQDSVL
jgi:hypothetical protein